MAISLLHRADSQAKVSPMDPRVLFHLSLDRSFSYVCADVNKRDRFLSILSALTDDPSDIRYRQEVIRDLYENPMLSEQLFSLFSRFEELMVAQKNAGRDEYRLNATRNTSLTSAKNILQTQALCLKRALLFVKAFGELLAGYSLRSSALLDLLGACREIYESPSFEKLVHYCAKYEKFSANGFLDFKVTWNEEGRIAAYELIDHRYIRITDPELKKKGFSLFKKADETVYPCERVYVPKGEFYETLAVSALSDLTSCFSSLSEQIFSRFAEIGDELAFYDVALRYVCCLDEKQVPYCFPTVTCDGEFAAEQLRDLYLLMTKESASDVVANDVRMPHGTGGVLVLGNNGSGKTVFLRSIGTLQVLVQAGLPVPCKHATVTPCSQIATQFSEAEKEFCEGNDAGRFEQEVRELAAMVDTLRDGALVLLNETFQSTAYREGAEGLYHLLKYFSEQNIRWILVSHLRDLEKMLAPDDAAVLHTAEGYRICQ